MPLNITPAAPLEAAIRAVKLAGFTAGIRALQERTEEFRSDLEATLTGIVIDPQARQTLETTLDVYWAERDGSIIIGDQPVTCEVIIGSGFHAAVYAATRVRAGFPPPIVLERSNRVGGTFAMTRTPTFFLNSRNRPGNGGIAGDMGASLNFLPSGLIQPANIGMTEYQTNADMALAIRLTLAQYAEVIPNTTVSGVDPDSNTIEVEVDTVGGGYTVYCGRVIDARGLGDPVPTTGSRVLTFPQLMQRMEGPWPLRGVKRVAVFGDGDSAKCAVETFLGLAPQPRYSVATLDHVERIDWFAPNLPDNCDDWQDDIRGRYQSIGRFLRQDRFGVRRVNIFNRQGYATPLPDAVIVEGRSYDLAVSCVGNRVAAIPGMSGGRYRDYSDYTPGNSAQEPIARKDSQAEVYRVGPWADLPFTSREREQEITEEEANRVAMFRTGSKTAMLAAGLTQPRRVD